MSDLLEDAGRAKTLNATCPIGEVLAQDEMWIRKLDPRVRIVAVLAFSVCVVQLVSLPLLAIALVSSLFMMVNARLPFWLTAKRVMMVDSFIILLLIMLPFTTPGVPVFYLFGFPASYEGIHQSIVVLLRANAIVMASISLLGTLKAVTFGHALAKLRVPESLVHLLLFTIRYIELLYEEYSRLRTAMKCRGFAPANSWHTYRTFGYLVGMLLIRAFERSERIMAAMKCRGFHGQFHLLQEFTLSSRDYAFSTLVGLFMVILLALEVMNVPFA